MFTGHIEITDKSQGTGFEQYLLIEADCGYVVEAYGIDDDTPLDIEALLQEVYRDSFDIETSESAGGPNYAAIITDNRTPDSVIVWTSCDWYPVDSEV